MAAATFYIRKRGANTNSGSSNALTPDRSGTDGTANNSTAFNSAAASFVAGDVDKLINVQDKVTNPGLFRIVAYVSATQVTVDRAFTGGAQTVITWSIGGALQTIAKMAAMNQASITDGDSWYIGAGVYREAITMNWGGTAAMVNIIGDVDGTQTGDAGDFIWNANLINDYVLSAGSPITLAGKSYLSFSKLTVIGTTASLIDASTKTSTNISFTDFAWLTHPNGNSPVNIAAAANVAPTWTLLRGKIYKNSQQCFIFTVDTPATADFNLACTWTNVEFIGGNGGCCFIQQGITTNIFKFGGLEFYNCSHLGAGQFLRAADANHSTTVTSKVYNSIMYNSSGVALQANVAGQIIEDHNLIYAPTPRTNVTAGIHSITSYVPGFEFGQSFVSGRQERPFGMPTEASSWLGFGAQAGGPTTDIMGKPRPSGITYAASGTATSGAAKTLTDTGASWGFNALAGATVYIISGTGSGQSKSIASNTLTVMTVDGNWITNPDSTSVYIVYFGALSTTGKATAIGAVTTMTDSDAAWGINQWAGCTFEFVSGTGSPVTGVITSNTATVLTFPAIAAACDTTTVYHIYRATSISTQNYAVGAYVRTEMGQKEDDTFDAGGVAIRIVGKGTHDWIVPVDDVSTVITIRVRYDASHGTGSKPQAIILTNGEIGVVTETQTATGSADIWETLTFSAFTPTAKGWIVLRLQSRSAAPYGIAFFDTSTITPPASIGDMAYFNRGEVLPVLSGSSAGGGGPLIGGRLVI